MKKKLTLVFTIGLSVILAALVIILQLSNLSNDSADIAKLPKLSFTEVTEQSGFSQMEAISGHLSWGDVNSDGCLEPILLRNNCDGTFSLAEYGVKLMPADSGDFLIHPIVFGDYDRDGDEDVFIGIYDGLYNGIYEGIKDIEISRMYRNDDGHYTDISDQVGISVLGGKTEQAIWGDYDSDGDLDLFVPYNEDLTPYRNYLYRNDNGAFSEFAIQANADDSARQCEGSQWADFDFDGDLDLYIGGKLLQNQSDGSFIEVNSSMQLPYTFDEGMVWVDFNNDGYLDLFFQDPIRPYLFKNVENTHFVEYTEKAGIDLKKILAVGGRSYGSNWADFDNDGDEDYLHDNFEYLTFFENTRGKFVEKTIEVGFPSPESFYSTCCSAIADYDLDGDLDIMLSNIQNVRIDHYALWANQINTWDFTLRFRVVDDEGYQVAQGAVVQLKNQKTGWLQTKVVATSSYIAQSMYDVHFGVETGAVYDLRVYYPSNSKTPVVINGEIDLNKTDIQRVLLVTRSGKIYAESSEKD